MLPTQVPLPGRLPNSDDSGGMKMALHKHPSDYIYATGHGQMQGIAKLALADDDSFK